MFTKLVRQIPPYGFGLADFNPISFKDWQLLKWLFCKYQVLIKSQLRLALRYRTILYVEKALVSVEVDLDKNR